jgi:hypothetical protein
MKEYFRAFVPVVVLLALFVGSMVMYNRAHKDDEYAEYNTPAKASRTTTTAEDIENYKDNRYGKAVEIECSWCGGIGKVGFAGASEAQCKRTGMGQGNYCTTCKGTGKVKVRDN